MDRRGYGRRNRDDGRFASADRREIGTVDQYCFELWRVGESRHAVFRERSVLNLPLFELDRLEQRAAETLDDSAFDLVFQMVGIENGAAFERSDGANNADLASLIRRNLGARRD